jgi:tRNA threonylcarbamoyladenosine biosynthesis protein TsaE
LHDDPALHAGSRVTCHLADESATLALGARLAPGLEPGMRVYLHGELGAGKTTLARGMLRALGHTGRVKSPTYSLVELYKFSRLYLYHFDFFRLDTPQDWLDAGFAEYFTETAVCLVEWPEKAHGTLPPADLEIYLSPAGGARDALLVGATDAGRRCLSTLADASG